MIEGTPEYIKSKNYWVDAKDVYLKNPKINKAFTELKQYLTLEPTKKEYLTEEEIKLWESGHVFQDPWPKNIVKMIS